MRVAVEISANANADLKLPRRLRFECEPSITQCPTPLLIGYKTLVGTGLLDIVLGIESYEREIRCRRAGHRVRLARAATRRASGRL
jgi:hypothetical protein